MGNGIESCRCSNRTRLADRQLRIEDCHAKTCLGIAAGHLAVRLRIGDQCVSLRFAARARSRGNPYTGKHRKARFAETPVIAHGPAIGQNKVDTFGAVSYTHLTLPTSDLV